MSTIIKLKRDYFTLETTQAFLSDLENVCTTMHPDLFVKLFIKYDLYYDEEYQDVLNIIIAITSNWYFPERGTVLLDITPFDSKCIFCRIGSKVSGYKWNYKHILDDGIRSRVVYNKKIAFIFEFENERLSEFGVCNGYV